MNTFFLGVGSPTGKFTIFVTRQPSTTTNENRLGDGFAGTNPRRHGHVRHCFPDGDLSIWDINCDTDTDMAPKK